MSNQAPIITATLVSDDDQRMQFLPTYFTPRYMMAGENAVYRWMRRLCKSYTGGFWNYYTLSNGGFYMAPKQAGKVDLCVPENGVEEELTAESAGIAVTLYALSNLAANAWSAGHDDVSERLSEHYHALRRYAAQQPEREAIRRVID